MMNIENIFAELGFGKELHKFYRQSICSDQYKYIMIVPRKCMTEYKCLCKEHPELKFKEGVYYMTPKSFAQYKEKMMEDLRQGNDISILIIDDIMMYGRGINQVLRDLVNAMPDFKQELIDALNIDVFIESNRDFIIDDDFLPIIEERTNCYISYNEFKNVLRASDLFLESFYAKLVPNTSFVNAWFFKNKEKGNEIKQHLDTEIKNHQDGSLSSYNIEEKEDQKKYGYHSIVYYENQEEWMDKLAEFYCIRYYYNGKDNPFLVPYVFLKPMTGEQIDTLLESFQKFLDIPQIWEGTSDDLYILKYEYLTKLISDCYGLIFMTQYFDSILETDMSWNNFFDEDDIVTEFTFGHKNVLSMEELHQKLGSRPKEIVKNILSGVSCDDIAEFEEEHTSGQLLNDAINTVTESNVNSPIYVRILETFLKYSNLQDEKLAKEKKERYFGLSTIRIKNMLEKGINSIISNIVDLYGEMIRFMDIGAASVSIKKLLNNNIPYYGAIMNSGEQSYRLMQEDLHAFIHYMALIEKNCLYLCMEDYTEIKINDFLGKLQTEDTNNELPFERIREMQNALRERNGRYSDIDVQRSSDAAGKFDTICQKIYEQIQY